MTTLLPHHEVQEIEALRRKIVSRWNLPQKGKTIRPEVRDALQKIGLFNFDTMEELNHWRKWENDDLQLEKRIKQALNEC